MSRCVAVSGSLPSDRVRRSSRTARSVPGCKAIPLSRAVLLKVGFRFGRVGSGAQMRVRCPAASARRACLGSAGARPAGGRRGRLALEEARRVVEALRRRIELFGRRRDRGDDQLLAADALAAADALGHPERWPFAGVQVVLVAAAGLAGGAAAGQQGQRTAQQGHGSERRSRMHGGPMERKRRGRIVAPPSRMCRQMPAQGYISRSPGVGGSRGMWQGAVGRDA